MSPPLAARHGLPAPASSITALVPHAARVEQHPLLTSAIVALHVVAPAARAHRAVQSSCSPPATHARHPLSLHSPASACRPLPAVRHLLHTCVLFNPPPPSTARSPAAA